MSRADADTIVVGAGAAGLAAARTLEAAGRETLVLDANAQPGGVMQTRDVAGYRVELGPNTIRVRPGVKAFLEEHDLLGAIEKASPASRRRQLFFEGQLVDVPDGPLAMLRSPLLSAAGKARVLAEPFIRRGDATYESVAEFIGRRVGVEVVTNLLGPFLTGVYAGDEQKLGAEAVFPALVELERARGSLAIGGIASAVKNFGSEASALPGSYAGRGGFGAFAAALAEPLRDLRLETRVEALSHDGEHWRVSTGEAELRSKSLLLATPGRASARLLAAVSPQAAEGLDAIEYSPIAAVALGADPKELKHRTDGFGFLVPREAKLGLLGCLFMSRLFAGRAPEGRVLLHCMMGGVRWPEALDLSDAELGDRACEGVDRTLGLGERPEVLLVSRWKRAVAQPGVRHNAQVAEIRRRFCESPRLETAGSHLDGVSVGDTLESGVAAARRLLARD